MSQIDDLVNQAAAQAKKMTENVEATLPATTTQGNVITYPAAGTPGAPLTMDSMVRSGVTPDRWISVKEDGIKILKDKGLYVKHIDAFLDMESGVAPCMAVKDKNGNYKKTYDMLVAVSGEPWPQIVAEYARLGERPYRSADIALTVSEDVTLGDETLAKKGEILGISLSTTNWNYWERFYRSLVRDGLQTSLLKVRLGYERKSSTRNGKTWGVYTFEFLDVIEDRSSQEAA